MQTIEKEERGPRGGRRERGRRGGERDRNKEPEGGREGVCVRERGTERGRRERERGREGEIETFRQAGMEGERGESGDRRGVGRAGRGRRWREHEDNRLIHDNQTNAAQIVIRKTLHRLTLCCHRRVRPTRLLAWPWNFTAVATLF